MDGVRNNKSYTQLVTFPTQIADDDLDPDSYSKVYAESFFPTQIVDDDSDTDSYSKKDSVGISKSVVKNDDSTELFSSDSRRDYESVRGKDCTVDITTGPMNYRRAYNEHISRTPFDYSSEDEALYNSKLSFIEWCLCVGVCCPPLSYIAPAPRSILQPSDSRLRTFPNSFFELFNKKNEGSAKFVSGIKLLLSISDSQKARLPLFDQAGKRYKQLILCAITNALLKQATDRESLETKRCIIACAAHYRYAAYLTNLIQKRNTFSHGIQLAGVDLRNLHLDKINLDHANLEGTDFRRSCLHGAQFCNAYMERADLREASIVDANFKKANVTGMKMTEIEWNKGRNKSLERLHLESEPVSRCIIC